MLAAAQVLFEGHGEASDPWMTLVGYTRRGWDWHEL
jgi:hypothetical protein